jgi:two-component system, NarL family, nitrate/nitrite response regulator NarL
VKRLKTCLICDDHAMLREALAGAVATGWPEASISQADDFPSAWRAAEKVRPDLILTDLTMPGAAPIVGVSELMRSAPGTPVLVITGAEDEALLMALFELGIAGFAPKSSRGSIITAAIELILAGGRYLPPEVLAYAAARRNATPVRTLPRARLTERQTEILALMADGASNKDIARRLDLSPATVKTHAAAAFANLDATNRTDAVTKAKASGLI